MTYYRRVKYKGITSFFTVVTYRRKPFFTDSKARECLKQAIEATSNKYPFLQRGFCLMPDHIHSIWTLPEDDDNYSIRWSSIKSGFSRLYGVICAEAEVAVSREKRRERYFWQRRYWEHMLRDEEDYRRHFDYIHYNPVKHGFVQTPAEWKWSSFHTYVDKGVYEPEWNPYLYEDYYNYGE